jgi:CD109 antigen
MPYGCGEQNMLNFVPNIVVLTYLTNLNKLTTPVETKCKKFMEVGYQRELTYRHSDGSYSAFGNSDRHGSTWLTAFVAKSFHQAAKFIHIDAKNVEMALEFLKNVQTSDGSFPEKGQVFHSDMQGGASNGIALTAYTLITFLENKEHGDKYKPVIKKALDYIVRNCEDLKDTYSLAIATYAFQLADHEYKTPFMNRLEGKSQGKDGLKFWTKDDPKDDPKDDTKDDTKNTWHRQQVNSVNVEMSAYALQALLLANRDADSVPVMKWLVTQRNANGGFQSTQDTVVGLQALSKLATRIYVPDSALEVTVAAGGRQVALMALNAGNALVLQKHELPSEERQFAVHATGRGFSILQVSYRYNVDQSGQFPRFTLRPEVQAESNKEFLKLRVCTAFVPDAQAERSNMAVMEVALPSGFTFDADSLEQLLATERVKKVETKDGDTLVQVYFDDIDKHELCPVISAYRTHAVAKQKPVAVVVYDYYDNSELIWVVFL